MATFQESARCPVCLTVGEMRFQYGNYCCDRCDQCWRTDMLGHWMKAFAQGREYEQALRVSRGGLEPHKLIEAGATPAPATIFT